MISVYVTNPLNSYNLSVILILPHSSMINFNSTPKIKGNKRIQNKMATYGKQKMNLHENLSSHIPNIFIANVIHSSLCYDSNVLCQ